MEEDIVKKIQNIPLTKTDKQIADYLLVHLNTVALQTSTSLALEIGVSDTSVIRFLRKLGFQGYSDFRREMSSRAVQWMDQTQKESMLPSQKYALTLGQIDTGTLVSNVQSYTLTNMQETFSQLQPDTLEQVVNIILKSKRKYIAGFRSTACCAKYMASKLLYLCSHVVSVTHADATAVETILDITARDCLILYSFPRHTEICRLLMEIAHKQGAKIILVTDQYTSPLACLADLVLVAKITGLGFTNSYTAPLSLSEVILLAVSKREDVQRSGRIDRIDKVMEKEKLY